MTTEKRTNNPLANMPPKQKIIIVVIVIFVLVIAWQVVGLFGGGGSAPAPTITPATTGKMNPNAPGAPGNPALANGASARGMTNGSQGMTNSPQGMANGSPGGQQAPQSSGSNMPQQAPVQQDPYVLEQQRSQKEYLSELSKLGALKIERQIEETNQAIAAAKLAIVTSEKSTADLLTKPTPVVSESAYASQLANSASPAGAPTGPPPLQQPPAEVLPDSSYTVISVSFQFNKWNAVIGAQGKLYNVSVGDSLPLDGSMVTSISRSGVVLKKGHTLKKFNMTTAI